MKEEDVLLLKPNYTMVYHKDIGCSIQLVLKEITSDGMYIFSKLEDTPLTKQELVDCFEIIQL